MPNRTIGGNRMVKKVERKQSYIIQLVSQTDHNSSEGKQISTSICRATGTCRLGRVALQRSPVVRSSQPAELLRLDERPARSAVRPSSTNRN